MSGSVFDLKTSPAELPSVTQGTANLSYQQVSSQPEITNTNFGGGTKKFKFDIQGTKWWVPSRSYFRMRVAIYRQAGTDQPTQADNIAPAMGLMSGLFQSGEFKMAGRTVSKIEDNMAQIDALQTRLSKSKAWLDSVGAGSNYWQPDFTTRQALLVADPAPLPSADINLYASDDHVALGYIATVEIAINSGTGVITFSNGQPDNTANGPDGTPRFQVGDIFQFSRTATNGNYAGQYFNVVAVTAATLTVLQMSDSNSADLAATGLGVADNGALAFYRRRPPAPPAVPAGHNIVELVWQPPLSIFQQQYALPVGSYEIDLTPYSNDTWRKNIIQSINADKVYGTDYNINIVDMYMYISTMEGQRVDNMTYYLSLDECNVQPFAVDSTTSNQKKQADVSPSTYALTCAFQQQGTGNNTLYQPSSFKFTATATDMSLTQLYIQYAGQTRPSPYADPEYTATTDYITQRWLEDNIYSGGYFDNGGSETKADWIARGPYYHFSWPKDGNDTSTRSYVNYKFSTAPGAGGADLLLFSHYKKTVGVSISNGQVSEISEQLA